MAQTVLVVEDDPANAVLIETILRSVGGFEVVCEDDGDEVLRLAGEGAVAAVLMDVSLHDTRVGDDRVDGVELTRRIRGLERGAKLPVLLLTAHAMRGDRESLLFASGANDYMTKPIADHDDFVATVRRLIQLAATDY